ncbi:MAG TPA: HAD family hydrolase [Candidatus Dormibacteraeota bacterium]|nr:HAD family hydrolase [Candidatus Dormibacteraeota bacterium]
MDFVFDLDGTICFKGRPVSDNILDALADLTNKGHRVIFASARPIRDMLPVIREDFHHYTMVGGNGSLIAEQGKVVSATAFSLEEFAKIEQLMNEFEATYLIDGNWDYAYTGPSDHPILENVDPGNLAESVSLKSLTSIVKVLILTSKNNKRLAEKLSKLDVYVNKHGNENVIDISPKGIHKWSALESLGVRQENYVAFGNDSNDVTMFEHALHTVMIGYHDQLVQVAKEIIHNEQNLEQKIVEKLKELSDRYIGRKV